MEAQAITEVEIKEQQLVIAQWMQVPEEIIGILNYMARTTICQ